RSKAVSARNIVSVARTLVSLGWRLRGGRLFRSKAAKVDERTKAVGGTASKLDVETPGVMATATEPDKGGDRNGSHSACLAPTRPLRIVLTGASSGIGAAMTKALAKDGHQLFVCARRLERLNQVTENNTLARGWACDVSDESQVQR